MAQNPAKKYRKIADVDLPLLLEMNQQTRQRDFTLGEIGPGPMVLPVHDLEELLSNRLCFHSGRLITSDVTTWARGREIPRQLPERCWPQVGFGVHRVQVRRQ